MATKTKNETLKAPEGFGDSQDISQALPPLAILRVGDKLEGVMTEVNLVEDEEKPGKYRNFYRFNLTAELVCEDKDGKEVTFKTGDSISLPGSGGLDYAIGKKALVIKGLPSSEKNIPWTALTGHWFAVIRKDDEEMTRGKHKGKPVKCYNLVHAAPKKG